VNSSSGPDSRLGSLLQDKYELVRVIGEGGMGRVYEGRHRTTTRRVAVKFVSLKYEANPQILQRFEREARAAGGLEHPSIAAVLDFGSTPEGVNYLVLEYLDGENCQKLLQREGMLPVPRALNIVNQVCDGLAAAHEAGVVHRDLKPANLFVCKRKSSDQPELVKILDFGIAKLHDVGTAGDDTPSGASLGTPQYMSPEQARGAKNLDHRSDIYALGAILYESLAGRKAHGGDSPLETIFNILHTAPEPLGSLRPELPKGLLDVVERAMEKDPELRFQSAAEFKAALAEFGWPGPGPRKLGAASGDATAPGTLTPEGVVEGIAERRRKSLPSEPQPTFVPVASSRPAAGVAWGPWVRAAALAVIAIGAGGVGGWLAARRSPAVPGPNSPAVLASAVVVPVPVSRIQVAERRAADLPIPKNLAPAPKSSRAPSSKIYKRPLPSPAPGASAIPVALPAPPSSSSAAPGPRAPDLWRADEGWLDQQR
jgi:eukaryotic-like serine/threonine-protein kinase